MSISARIVSIQPTIIRAVKRDLHCKDQKNAGRRDYSHWYEEIEWSVYISEEVDRHTSDTADAIYYSDLYCRPIC